MIIRCSDASQFVWIPVGNLKQNGTLDGEFFNEKFGIRNYQVYEEKKKWPLHNNFANQLALQIESVKKYGGFYISRYNISKNPKTGNPQSDKGAKPLTNIDFNEAKKIAASMENSSTISSHLTFGAEYDSLLEWIIESGVKTHKEIAANSTNWGNYKNAIDSSKDITNTGLKEQWCVNRIYDLAGNVREWVQEYDGYFESTIRGGDYKSGGYDFPVAYKCYSNPEVCDDSIGFRVALYIR